MKTTFEKQVPKILYYRNYNYFNNEAFRNDLFLKFSTLDIHNIECSEFEDLLLKTLHIHAPLKKRYIRANNAPFMTKDLCKPLW